MLRLALLLLTPLLFACRKASTGQPPGRAYYDALNCRACHRIGDEGGLGGPDLTLVGLRHTPAWLDTFLENPQAWRPGTTMPNPDLSRKALVALRDYLSGLKGQAFNGAPPWNDPSLVKKPVERGLMIYARAGCIACHGKDGRGGYPNNNVKGNAIPPLSGVSRTYTKAELARKIKNGAVPERSDPNGPSPLVAMPKWGEVLKDDEIAAVVDYLFSLKSGAPDAGF
ncbi:MAG: c-type cytochrome [Elusimicrobia bacterium]|nr:c-type cytochrome [Elusimicrobiota bacterium]